MEKSNKSLQLSPGVASGRFDFFGKRTVAAVVIRRRN